ncbi:hypothetical protein [Metabacillus sp. Hm71]|uniref:hypothetical protein n=1 Tax=Metabacillus sp. Hm71 TaxID=3450743 RepID=UPI003F43618A
MHFDTAVVKWEYEDNLGVDLTEEMFKSSRIIDGVRMYPYVIIGFSRYYLESL